MEDFISFIYNLDSRQAPVSVPNPIDIFLFGSPGLKHVLNVFIKASAERVTNATEMCLRAYCWFYATEMSLRAY